MGVLVIAVSGYVALVVLALLIALSLGRASRAADDLTPRGTRSGPGVRRAGEAHRPDPAAAGSRPSRRAPAPRSIGSAVGHLRAVRPTR